MEGWRKVGGGGWRVGVKWVVVGGARWRWRVEGW